MPAFRLTTTVAAPPAAVFAVLADPKHVLRTQPGTTKSDLVTPPPLRQGSVMRRARVVDGRAVEGDAQVVVFRPDKEIEVVGGAQGISVSYRYVLKPEGEGTKLTLDVTVEGSGLASLFTGAVTSALQRADADHLERVRELAGS